jgi:hypothetical protein
MNLPQGLKPLVISAFFGTTEVVPFQNSLAIGVFIQVLRLFISNHNYAALNKHSPSSFLAALLGLTSKDRAKFPVAFQKES